MKLLSFMCCVLMQTAHLDPGPTTQVRTPSVLVEWTTPSYGLAGWGGARGARSHWSQVIAAQTSEATAWSCRAALLSYRRVGARGHPPIKPTNLIEHPRATSQETGESAASTHTLRCGRLPSCRVSVELCSCLWNFPSTPLFLLSPAGQGDVMPTSSINRADVAAVCVEALTHSGARNVTLELVARPGEPEGGYDAGLCSMWKGLNPGVH